MVAVAVAVAGRGGRSSGMEEEEEEEVQWAVGLSCVLGEVCAWWKGRGGHGGRATLDWRGGKGRVFAARDSVEGRVGLDR